MKFKKIWLLFLLFSWSIGAHAQESSFQRGYAAFLKKDYLGTVAALKAASLPHHHPLKDYERFALGQALIETNDPKAAIPVLEALIKDEPTSRLAPAANVQLLRALVATGDTARALTAMQALPADLASDLKGQALYYAGEAELASGRKDAAIQRFREAYVKNPGSGMDEDILARLGTLASGSFSAQESLERGLKLFDAKRCTQAQAALEPVINSGLPENLLARVIKGECLYQAKRYGDAALYLSAARSGLPAERARPAMLHLGISELRSQSNAQALSTLEKVQQNYPGTVEGEEALYRIGMIHLEAKQYEAANAAMKRLAGQYASGNWRDKGLWAVAWESFRQKKYDTARSLLELMASGAADPPTAGKAIYWLGGVAEKSGDSAKAKAEWTRAYQTSPFSYYGVMALKKLKGLNALDQTPPLPPEWKSQAPAGGGATKGSTPSVWKKHFDKVLALYRLGFGKESLPEIDLAVKAVDGNPGEQRALMEATRRSEAYFMSILMGQKYWETFKRQFPNPQAAEDYRANLLYPNAFRSEVDRASREFNVPSELIIALMRQESGFMPWAVSSANAQGLMQLLPSTAAPRAQLLGLSGYDLFDPSVNIRLGTSELSNMLQRFNQNWAMAFSGYNAGPGRAKEWGEDFGQLPMDEWIEEIPFGETNLYVKLVLRNYWAYRLLYPAG